MGRCGCGGSCADCQPAPPARRQEETSGRFRVERGPETPLAFGRSFDRNYDVQAFTGYPVSTVPAGRWNRGILYRNAMPVLQLQSMGPMYDPTDPTTWPNRVG